MGLFDFIIDGLGLSKEMQMDFVSFSHHYSPPILL